MHVRQAFHVVARLPITIRPSFIGQGHAHLRLTRTRLLSTTRGAGRDRAIRWTSDVPEPPDKKARSAYDYGQGVASATQAEGGREQQREAKDHQTEQSRTDDVDHAASPCFVFKLCSASLARTFRSLSCDVHMGGATVSGSEVKGSRWLSSRSTRLADRAAYLSDRQSLSYLLCAHPSSSGGRLDRGVVRRASNAISRAIPMSSVRDDERP